MDNTKSAIGSSEGGHFLFDDWFDPLENGVRTRIRVFIEELLEAELDDEPIIRLILDGTAVRVRLDKKATSISLLVVLGVRSDGQKALLAIKNMGGESEAAWRPLLDNLVARGLKMPELVTVDGSSGLDKALAALCSDVPVQRCTVHKHRNLLAHSPDRLHEEVSADYNDMIYAKTKQEIEAKRKVFIW
jgi:transposase-like protein